MKYNFSLKLVLLISIKLQTNQQMQKVNDQISQQAQELLEADFNIKNLIEDEQYELQASQSKSDFNLKPQKEIQVKQKQKQYPSDHIGCIHAQYSHQGVKYYTQGTATLITNNIVLTCAHNIFKREFHTKQGHKFTVTKQYPQRIIFVLGNQVRQTKNQSDWYIPSQFKNHPVSQRQQYDYALIHFDKPINLDTMPLYILEKYEDLKRELKLIGYCSQPNQKQVSQKVEKVEGEKYDQRLGIMYSRANTQSGLSGSPIMHKFERFYAIVGIHLGQNKKSGLKLSKYFNDKMYESLKQLVNQKHHWAQIARNIFSFSSAQFKVDLKLENQFNKLQMLFENPKLIQKYKILYQVFYNHRFFYHAKVLQLAKLEKTTHNYNTLNFLNATKLFYYQILSGEVSKFEGSFIFSYKYGKFLYDALVLFQPEQQDLEEFNSYKQYWSKIIGQLADSKTQAPKKQKLRQIWGNLFTQALGIVEIIPLDEVLKQFLKVYCLIAIELCQYQSQKGDLINVQVIFVSHIKMFRLLQHLAKFSDGSSQILTEIIPAIGKLMILVQKQHEEFKILECLQANIRKSFFIISRYISNHCPKNSRLQQLRNFTYPHQLGHIDSHHLDKILGPAISSLLN